MNAVTRNVPIDFVEYFNKWGAWTLVQRREKLNTGMYRQALGANKTKGGRQSPENSLSGKEAKKGNTSDTRDRMDGESPSDDDTPRRLHSSRTASFYNV